jgi:hypothetical protein
MGLAVAVDARGKTNWRGIAAHQSCRSLTQEGVRMDGTTCATIIELSTQPWAPNQQRRQLRSVPGRSQDANCGNRDFSSDISQVPSDFTLDLFRSPEPETIVKKELKEKLKSCAPVSWSSLSQVYLGPRFRGEMLRRFDICVFSEMLINCAPSMSTDLVWKQWPSPGRVNAVPLLGAWASRAARCTQWILENGSSSGRWGVVYQ